MEGCMARNSIDDRAPATRRAGRWLGVGLAAAAALSLAGLAGFAAAQLPGARSDARTPRSLLLDEALLETVRVEGQVQSWTLRKLCIDGQAYWVGFGDTTPTGIGAAFRDGKPEQCVRRGR
jgi:hypothetical protein